MLICIGELMFFWTGAKDNVGFGADADSIPRLFLEYARVMDEDRDSLNFELEV